MASQYSMIDILTIYHNEILPNLDIDNLDKEVSIDELVEAVKSCLKVHPEYKDIALHIMALTTKIVTNHKPNKTLNAFITLFNHSDLKHTAHDQ